jgi:hypothetical protein
MFNDDMQEVNFKKFIIFNLFYWSFSSGPQICELSQWLNDWLTLGPSVARLPHYRCYLVLKDKVFDIKIASQSAPIIEQISYNSPYNPAVSVWTRKVTSSVLYSNYCYLAVGVYFRE